MFISPTEDRVLIKVKPPDRETSGGIALPDPKERKPNRGVVVAIGPGLSVNGRRREPDLSIGDVAFWPVTVGKDLKLGDDYYVVIRESDILMCIGE